MSIQIITDLLNKFKLIENDQKKINNKIDELKTKQNILEKELNDIKKEITDEKKKGSNCSVSGNNYEKQVHNVIKYTTLNKKPFHTQKVEELAGSTSGNDIICNYKNQGDIGIEVKKAKTPDWMQCSLKREKGKWVGSEKGKIPIESKKEFNKLLKNIKLFNGKIPPFFEKSLTYEEWTEIKKSDKSFDDYYVEIPKDTINKLYLKKGCHYIQISDYGLYYLKDDICKLNVPKFDINQKMRIRIKVHSRGKEGKSCSLSVTASCMPEDIKKLPKSPFSLDSIDKLPKNLIYKI